MQMIEIKNHERKTNRNILLGRFAALLAVAANIT
jgi:hypothetical protein